MDSGKFINSENIVRNLQAKTQWQAIDELMDNLVATGKVRPEHRDALCEAVKERERSMTTAIGDGVAIPHATTTLVDDVVSALGKSQEGVRFAAIAPVHLVILFLVPKGQFQKHLQTLASIAKALQEKGFRENI